MSQKYYRIHHLVMWIRKAELRMNELEKYKVIKDLVDHNKIKTELVKSLL